jgi:hypothetical protein
MHFESPFFAPRRNAHFPKKTRGTILGPWYYFSIEKTEKEGIGEKIETQGLCPKSLISLYLVDSMGFR